MHIVTCNVLVAFHAFLRVIEITVCSRKSANAVIQLSDCRYVEDKKGEKCLELSIRNCKGNINRAPFTLMITQGKNVKYC